MWKTNSTQKRQIFSAHAINSSPPLDKMAAILAEDIFNYIFLKNENDRIPIQISLKYVPMSPIDNKPALVMTWHRRTGDKPLPGPLMTQFIDAYMRH